MTELLSRIGDSLSGIDDSVFSYATMIIRLLLPALAIIIIIQCVRSLMQDKSEIEYWGYLSLPNGSRIYLNHWENIIGRSKSSDVYMEYPTLSRSHAAVIRDESGNWRAYDVDSKTGVIVNGSALKEDNGVEIKTGDVIQLGGVELVFFPADKQSEHVQAEARTRPGRFIKQRTMLIFVTEFQLLLAVQLCISKGDALTAALPLCFLTLIGLMWACYLFTRALNRVAFEIETAAFFLCSIGMGITAASAPSEIVKQTALLAGGVCLFFVIGWFLRDLDRVKKARLPIAAAGLLLLGANILFGKEINGAKNWIVIAGISFQPSEFVKLAFVFAGAATLDKLFTRRSLMTFIGFSGACVIGLALINDFGMALVFFIAYLMIAFLRSGDFATIFLSIGGAGFAGFLAIRIKSHIAGRFATWGRAWEHAGASGYQQTRAMAAIAEGGLFGIGAGRGWLIRVFAADTDIVFGMVCQELGLIVGIAVVGAILMLAVFSARSAEASRSSYYLIGACAASTILVSQMLLNVMGTVDILPFTGMTFPFISKGGSSLISSWGLLAYIKAADTRQNASFVVKTPRAQGSGVRG